MPDVGDFSRDTNDAAWWRDHDQGHALAAGDLTPFHADVSFKKLRARVHDDSAVPRTGPIDRILSSRFSNGEGVDFVHNCLSRASDCKGEFLGRLQPYAIYVPHKPRPAGGYGLTLLLHSLTANYNQYLASRNQSQYGERPITRARGPGSIVITSESRGTDGSYQNYAGAEVFEMWADVASRYRLDPAWTVSTGYSMGAIGTFTLAGQFPDLFARAQSTVGYDSFNLAPSLRNIPVQMWNGVTDELVGPELYVPTATELDDLGYRYELDVFTPGEHNSLAYNDQYAPAAAFLGTAKVDRNPAHVTYAVEPSLARPKLAYVADHAYWLSRVRVRDKGSLGTIDARSFALDPQPSATQHGAAVLTGGNLPAYPYSRQYKTWGPSPRGPRLDRIQLSAKNISAATLDVKRAGVSCRAKLVSASDGPLALHLAGCGRTVAVSGS
jgi:predicted esterase